MLSNTFGHADPQGECGSWVVQVASEVDVLYQTRIQRERFKDRPEEYELVRLAGWCLSLALLASDNVLASA